MTSAEPLSQPSQPSERGGREPRLTGLEIAFGIHDSIAQNFADLPKHLDRIAARITALELALEASPRSASAGSALLADDLALAPYSVTAASRDALAASVTQLRALRDALGPNLRTIEGLDILKVAWHAAVNAMWMLNPTDAGVRRTRLLQDVWRMNLAKRVAQVGFDARTPWEGDAVMWQIQQLTISCGLAPDSIKVGPDLPGKASAVGFALADKAGPLQVTVILPQMDRVLSGASDGPHVSVSRILHLTPFGEMPKQRIHVHRRQLQVLNFLWIIEFVITAAEIAAELLVARTGVDAAPTGPVT